MADFTKTSLILSMYMALGSIPITGRGKKYLRSVIKLYLFLLINSVMFFLFIFLFETGFLCITVLAVLELCFIDQVDLELRPACSVSQVLGLKASAVIPAVFRIFN